MILTTATSATSFTTIIVITATVIIIVIATTIIVPVITSVTVITATHILPPLYLVYYNTNILYESYKILSLFNAFS